MGSAAEGGLVIAFRGDLGAGKTVMSKGIARGLGVDDEVTSPTFTIISEYEGRLRLHHIDAYRLSGPEDFAEIGGEDFLHDKGSVCLVEWSERISRAMPQDACSVELTVMPDGKRRALLEGSPIETAAGQWAGSRR